MVACRGKKDLAQMLLARGADPNKVNQKGNTPLDVAVRFESIAIIGLLVVIEENGRSVQY